MDIEIDEAVLQSVLQDQHPGEPADRVPIQDAEHVGPRTLGRDLALQP